MVNTKVRPTGTPAGFVVRLAVALYDGLILFSICFLTFVPVTLAENHLGDAPVWLKGVLLMAITYAYFVGFWVKCGATTGMRPWKLQLAMADTGQPLSLETATMRFVGMLVTVVALGLPMITIFFTRKRQALHDLLAGTAVFRIKI